MVAMGGALMALTSNGRSSVTVTVGQPITVDLVMTVGEQWWGFDSYLTADGPGFYVQSRTTRPPFDTMWILDDPEGDALYPETTDNIGYFDLAGEGVSAGTITVETFVLRNDAEPGDYLIEIGDPGNGVMVVGPDGEILPLTFSSLSVTVADLATPLAITQASSIKSHGGQSYSVDLLSPRAIENRQGGPTKVNIQFNQPISLVEPDPVHLSSGVVDNVAGEGDTLVISMSGVTSPGLLTISFPGVVGTVGGSTCSGSLCLAVLEGDVTGDGRVNSLDLLEAKNQANQALSAVNFKADVNADGKIDNTDLLAIRYRLNRIVGQCP